jgi:hypothetical protein
VKSVNTGGVPWVGHPFLYSPLSTPGENGAVGPLHGRSDPTTPSPAEASFTPSADQPEEVPGDELLGEADDQGSE